MANEVTLGSEGREKLQKGINIIADAVKSTLGARGRTVIISNGYGKHITKDGVTVARAINLEDEFERLGASLLQEVAAKSVDQAGDGTTTAVILGQAIINAGIKSLQAGANPVDLKKGIDKAVEDVIKNIQALSKKVSPENLKQVATISANNDEETGTLIADTFNNIGEEGVVTVEFGKSSKTYSTVIEGMQINKGYISPYFVSDSLKMRAELENPYILICDAEVMKGSQLVPLMEQIMDDGKPILLITGDCQDEALAFLVLNNNNRAFKACAIKAPEYGDDRRMTLEDIAVFTGGTIVSEEHGTKIEAAKIEHLGRATRVIVEKDRTTIIGGRGKKEDIDSRCQQIRTFIEEEKNEDLVKVAKERLGKLSTGIAVITVGGITDSEIKEKKDRIDDAVCATRAAIEEGFVAGGGITFLQASQSPEASESEDFIAGYKIVMNAVKEPFKTILNNAGKDPGEYIKEINTPKYGVGYNAKTEKIEDLFQAGIIDPTKVLRVSLENAASVAGMFLTTNCVITEKPKK